MKKVELTKNKVATVDDCDFKKVSKFNWYCQETLSNRFYARRTTDGLYLHTFLMGNFKNKVIDHINGNSLDNTRDNLRFCDFVENLHNKKVYKNNKTGLKGIFRDRNRWRARITVEKRKISIGSYASKNEAALAYDHAAKHYFGNFALTNFV